MREYRGKRIDNGELVEGSLIGKDVIVGEIVEFNDEYFNTEFWYKVDPSTVGQYIGLNDHRKDKRIFIGDSIRGLKRGTDDEWHQVEVYEHKGCTMFGNWNAHEFFNKFQYIEVIGSNHDNPELLEVKG